jgi:hypothetical protein
MERALAEREAEIGRLNEDLAVKQKEIERLETANRLLKVDHRVARIDVLDQQGSAAAKTLVTTFTFVELDEKGEPLEQPRVFNVKGDRVYVDSLVAKFTDECIEVADEFRSTSLCSFQRIFGENQKPSDGFILDPVDQVPSRYKYAVDEKAREFIQDIFKRFWEYSNNPEAAAKRGIRSAHGEAPSQVLVPGKRYKVLLRSSGGLSFVPEEIPPKSAGQTF